MTQIQIKITPDTWINSTWDEYVQIVENELDDIQFKSYYYNQKLRIEMSPLGSDHSRDHAIIIYIIYQFAALKNIDIDGHDNCSYRKKGIREAQPDVSFYIGKNAEVIPTDTTIINLDQYPPPDLVIEVANTSLFDDTGSKRMLYEDLGVKEYWIIDVKNVEIIAFSIENKSSGRIRQSQVLPNLQISVLEEALQKTRTMNHGKVIKWLMEKLQNNI